MIPENEIIEGCKIGKSYEQGLLFKQYAPKLLGICYRYYNNKDEAEDVLQESFIKILVNIRKYKQKGSFEGWLKKIVINTALNNYRAQIRYNKLIEAEEYNQQSALFDESKEKTKLLYTEKEIMGVIQQLPPGYKLVFNLYVLDKYHHSEIAEMLNISVSTSKSQLSKARKVLRKELVKLEKRKKQGWKSDEG